MSTVRPTTSDQAKLWNFYNRPDHDWYKIQEWPDRMITAAISNHRDYMQRFNLFCFWVGNGIPIKQAKLWIMYGQTYDNAAVQHINHFARDTYLYSKANKNRYYDMINKSYEPFPAINSLF